MSGTAEVSAIVPPRRSADRLASQLKAPAAQEFERSCELVAPITGRADPPSPSRLLSSNGFDPGEERPPNEADWLAARTLSGVASHPPVTGYLSLGHDGGSGCIILGCSLRRARRSAASPPTLGDHN
jgi:hypothetical protein